MFSAPFRFILKLVIIVIAAVVIICLSVTVGCMPGRPELKQDLKGSGNKLESETKADQVETKNAALAVKNTTDQSDSSNKNNGNMDINFQLPEYEDEPEVQKFPPALPATIMQASCTGNACPIPPEDKSTGDDFRNILALACKQNAAQATELGVITRSVRALQSTLQQQAEAARAAIEARGNSEAKLAQVKADKDIAIAVEREKKWQYLTIAAAICAFLFLLIKSPFDWFKGKAE